MTTAPGEEHGGDRGPGGPTEDLLDSWKDIASYLQRDVRTVMRWERSRRLPVHRLPGGRKAAIYALKSELEAWRAAALGDDPEGPGGDPASPVAAASGDTAHAGAPPAARPRAVRLLPALAVVLLVLAAGVAAILLVRPAWRGDAARHALALDGNLAEAVGVLGYISFYWDWDFDAAGKTLARAVELNPGVTMVRHAYADYLMVTGDLAGSLEQVQAMRRNDPLSWPTRGILLYHALMARRYDDVVAEGRNPARLLDHLRPEAGVGLPDPCQDRVHATALLRGAAARDDYVPGRRRRGAAGADAAVVSGREPNQGARPDVELRHRRNDG